MSSRRPPSRYVPTLTEVVQPGARSDSAVTVPAAAAAAQEELVRRVLQRLDGTLERRLRERVAAVVAEQARALAPLLRDQIEAAVRQAVADAFEQEAQRSEPGN